jgi:hypothetical protein
LAKIVKDHLGNEFKSIAAMVRYYGVHPRSYYAKLQRGVPLKYILTETRKLGDFHKDHLGKEYPSLQAMCDAYGINSKVYLERTGRLGWGKKDALTTPVGVSVEKRTDHLGNVYPTFKAMCDNYGVSTHVVYKRLNKLGYTKEEALLTPVGCLDRRSRVSEEDICNS